MNDLDSTGQLDCIVRFHDIRRLNELNRCIFSLVGQTHRPLRILLAVQRFTEREVAAARLALEPLLQLPNAPALEVLNWSEPVPADGRTALLNLGLEATRGRYVAFLDYDDVLYPEAYTKLIGRLRSTGAAIAFATVRVVSANIYPEFIHVTHLVTPPFNGRTLRDLLRNNFCPIHSYVIDRQHVPELSFDTALAMEEDYDLLLRICARHPADFGQVATQIGDYYYKTDGSNTVPTEGGLTGTRLAAYERVAALIETRRQTTTIAPEVQRALGLLEPQQELTIRAALDLLDRLERR